MLYRKMPRIEEKLSILGFGAMRLPVNADGSVDDKTVDVMLHKAIEGGINYFDTAYRYHNGESETFVGRALSGHPRVFDPIFINLIKAGESTGKLPDVLQDLMEGLKWQDELASQAKKAVMYPSFVLLLVVGVALGMIFFLVPQMVELFAALQVPVPLQIRAMLAISHFLTNY